VARSISPKEYSSPIFRGSIGGSGEQVTLKLVAQYGDACNIHGDLATIEHKLTVLKEHCKTIGRDYQSIHRTTGTFYITQDTDEQALANVPDRANTALIGSPATIRERIVAYEEVGMQELILRFPEVGQLDTIRRFAQEFIV
jgi:alkanesulfonate monooxygenase SsuD/methylene tetrahydromethanopterin reductase-like flavin-dependent oxidoreductase (luciferase family)